MKRSKMIEIINSVIDASINPRNGQISHIWLGDKILNAVEEAGMLPPGFGTDLPNGDYIHKQEWEEE